MKNTFTKVILLVAFFSQFALAEENKVPTDKEISDTHATYCGTVEDLLAAMGQPDQKLTDAEIKELQEMRRPIFKVIKEGASALDAILKEGEKNDIGGLGVVLTCGVIDQISTLIQAKGCINLETQEKLHEGSGIQICKDILSKLKK